MKKLLFLPLFFVVFLSGCDLTPEEKIAIHEAALSAKATAQNFDAMKDKIQAKDPKDETLFEQWKADHSTSLNSAAAAMSDVDQRVNAKLLATLASKDLKAKQDAKKPEVEKNISFMPGKK